MPRTSACQIGIERRGDQPDERTSRLGYRDVSSVHYDKMIVSERRQSRERVGKALIFRESVEVYGEIAHQSLDDARAHAVVDREGLAPGGREVSGFERAPVARNVGSVLHEALWQPADC